MQSTRWRQAEDAPLARDNHYNSSQHQRDKDATKQKPALRKVAFAPPVRSQGATTPSPPPLRRHHTGPSYPVYTIRPTHHRPGFLEELLQRPYKVQCWGCHNFAWLPRKGPESPRDWTCGVCQTHQRRDKHGDLIPVPEMYDSALNEANAELIDHAVYRPRRTRHSPNNEDNDKQSVFCRTCRNNHRLTYQLMSAYLPDDDDPDYERLLNNIEHKRKVLEQRYPPVCEECLPKVEQVLAGQRANLRTNLFNVALKKSKVDHIRSIRKYPRLSWIVAALFWTCTNILLFFIHYYDAGLPDLLPPLGKGDTLKNPTRLFRELVTSATSAGQPYLVPYLLAAGLAMLAVLDVFWNPLQFSVEKSLYGQLRIRPTLKIVQLGSLPLRTFQCWSLLSLFNLPPSAPPKTILSASLLLLHIGFCMAFFNSRYIRDPVTISLGPSRASSRGRGIRDQQGHEDEEEEDQIGVSLEYELQHNFKHKSGQDSLRRTVSRGREEESSPFSGLDRPFNSYTRNQTDGLSPSVLSSSSAMSWNSRSSSPDQDNINWSPRKPRKAGDAGRLPPQFGTYRDPNSPASQNHEPGTALNYDQEYPTAFNRGGLQPLNPTNQFHSRAYEPSPLANPSIISSATQQGTSLGDLFGFPSARFQPPENHFAHRSATRPPQDMWAYRRMDDALSPASRPQGLLDDLDEDNDVLDEEDDDDDDENDDDGSDGDIRVRRARPKRMPKPKRKSSTSGVDDLFVSFGFTSTPTSAAAPAGHQHHHLNQRNKRDMDTFGQQRFFPPNASTGLEDNFFGAVKIADDDLSDIPRTREGRNMAMKKRLAIRWLLVGVTSRAIAHYVAVLSITLTATIVFAAVLLHAIGFWIVDQRQSWPLFGNMAGQGELQKFKPVLLDKVFSHILFLCCVGRLTTMVVCGLGYEDLVAHFFLSWTSQQFSWTSAASMLDVMLVISLLGLILAGSGHSSNARDTL